MNVEELKGKKVMMAVSGGLDSCTITHWLETHGVEVIAYTADLGQPDEENIEDVRQRMLACSAKEMILDDLKEEICVAGLQLVQAQARYEGGYWNTTGIARHVVVQAMVPAMQERGIAIMGHGATGRGNDQVRFQLATQMLDPKIQVYAPWRDSAFLEVFGGRKEMIDYCQQHGLPITATHDKPYSTDANILGLTHEAGELEDLTTPARRIDPGMGVFPEDAPQEPEIFSVRFEKGLPVGINGNQVGAYEALEQSNAIGGKNGIGIGLHTVENRFVGIKSRGVYEAPGMELLGQCYEYLLQLIIDRRARKLYAPISEYIAEQIYQGYWFDTATQASMKFVDHLNQLATGTIDVSLYKGGISFHSASDVPHSLYSEDTASMEAIGDFDHRDSEGFLGVLGVGARVLNTSGQV
jgi:argininosuccinate synthase